MAPGCYVARLDTFTGNRSSDYWCYCGHNRSICRRLVDAFPHTYNVRHIKDEEDIMSLSDEIDKMRREIRTDGYPMSIGEIASLYQDDELDIHPEFQRFFRWTIDQKSQFIESILLGIPIPPIFVSQRRSDSVWDVVDGLQRLSTIFEFMGILKDENGKVLPPLELDPTKYLPSLKGKRWQSDDEGASLTADRRIMFKRSKLNISILLRESDDIAKFELFQRLNRGGSVLSDQEVRNCILVMLNRDFYAWLRAMSEKPAFQSCTSLTDRALAEQYDVELVLRFIVLRDAEPGSLGSSFDIGDLITDRMIAAASNPDHDRREHEAAFDGVFTLLDSVMRDRAFRRYDTRKKRFLGGFTLTGFELVAVGLGASYPNLPDGSAIEELIKRAWAHDDTQRYSGMGVRASTRIPHLLRVGRELFRGAN